MTQSQEQSWEKFKTTGSVGDYLAYINDKKDNNTDDAKNENKN